MIPLLLTFCCFEVHYVILEVGIRTGGGINFGLGAFKVE